MIDQKYCAEIETLLVQFLSAMDDGKIYRKRKESDEIKIVSPRWIIGNKNRTFADLVNQAGNITFPAGVVEPNSISLRKEHLFNQQTYAVSKNHNIEYRYRQPLPVTIDVSVTFYTKTFNDFYQMVSNFAVYSNPYFFISIHTPTDVLDKYKEEIRCKVEWDGSIAVDYPKTATKDQVWVIKGTAGFKIDGFLFQKPITDPEGIIYRINTYATPSIYTTLLAGETDEYDYFVINGWPTLTALVTPNMRLVPDNESMSRTFVSPNDHLVFEGKSFFKRNDIGILIRSASEPDHEFPDLEKVSVETVKHGTVSGYSLPSELIYDVSDNIIRFKLPDLQYSKELDIIVYTNVGYASTIDNKIGIIQR